MFGAEDLFYLAAVSSKSGFIFVRLMKEMKVFVSCQNDSFGRLGVTMQWCWFFFITKMLEKSQNPGYELNKDRSECFLLRQTSLCTYLPLAGGKDEKRERGEGKEKVKRVRIGQSKRGRATHMGPGRATLTTQGPHK